MENLSIKERINEKVKEIEEFLTHLDITIADDFDLEDYKKNFKIRAICERLFEKIRTH